MLALLATALGVNWVAALTNVLDVVFCGPFDDVSDGRLVSSADGYYSDSRANVVCWVCIPGTLASSDGGLRKFGPNWSSLSTDVVASLVDP